MTVYDLHSHWGTESFYPLRGRAQQAKQVDIWKTECRFWTKEEMADYIRQSGVKTMLDIGFTRSLPLDEVRRMHDEVIDFQRSNADIVLGNWLQLGPKTGRDGLDELERCRKTDAGIFGLAVSAVGNNLPINDPSFLPFYDYCVQSRMPVLFFVGYTGVGAGMAGGNGIILELSHPRYVDDIAARFPKLEIVAGRSAWPWHAEMTAVLLHKANVWAEFHGASPKLLPDDVKREIRGRLKHKVMFGADYPLLRYEKLIGHWREEGYSEEVLERVFSKNAEALIARLQGN